MQFPYLMEYLSLTEKIYDKISGLACEWLQIIKYDFGAIQNIYGNQESKSGSAKTMSNLCVSHDKLNSMAVHIAKLLHKVNYGKC